MGQKRFMLLILLKPAALLLWARSSGGPMFSGRKGGEPARDEEDRRPPGPATARSRLASSTADFTSILSNTRAGALPPCAR
jgi:hypothetical protein